MFTGETERITTMHTNQFMMIYTIYMTEEHQYKITTSNVVVQVSDQAC